MCVVVGKCLAIVWQENILKYIHVIVTAACRTSSNSFFFSIFKIFTAVEKLTFTFNCWLMENDIFLLFLN